MLPHAVHKLCIPHCTKSMLSMWVPSLHAAWADGVTRRCSELHVRGVLHLSAHAALAGGGAGESAADGELPAGSADIAAGSKQIESKAGKSVQRRRSKVIRNLEASTESDFLRDLRDGAEANDFSALVARLRDMSPNAVDAQLRSMQVRMLAIASQEEQAGSPPLSPAHISHRCHVSGFK